MRLRERSPSWPQHLIVGALALAVVVLDQLSKVVVTRTLGSAASNASFELAGPGIAFRYVENRGAAFGIFGGQGGLVTVLAAAVLASVVVFYLRTAARSPWLLGAMGLIVGGALGNLIDRLARGYVVDFVAVGPWPTFNLADSAISVGVALLAVSFWRDEQTGTTLNAGAPPAEARAAGRRVGDVPGETGERARALLDGQP